ncbi:MAG: restriction endonuclease subunit S [Hungatella sp.]|nr:restriction endonuclease subunit S [Hungatella sp.]
MNSSTKLKYLVSLRNEKSSDSTLPYIGLENVQSNTGKYIEATEMQQPESSANLFNTGDILYGKLRPYLCKAMIAPFDGQCSGELLVFKSVKLRNEYLHQILLSHNFTSYVDSTTYGTKMPRANWSDVGEFKIVLPDLQTQDFIISYLERKTAQIDSIIADKEKLIELLKEKRQAIISEAVTRGLDPSVPMKDSGVDWIGQIPKHWEMSQSRWLFSLRKDRAFPDDEQLTASQQLGIVYQKDYMEQGSRVVQVITGEDILKHVEPNDFVISMRSFQGGIEWSGLRGKISSAYVMLIPDQRLVYSPFFKWLLKSDKYIRALQSTSNLVRDGQALRYSNFKQVNLPLISLDEQEQISNYLDMKTSQIDGLIQDISSQIVLLKEYRQSIISEAVTGKVAIS